MKKKILIVIANYYKEISLGLWIGRDSSPNKEKDASQSLSDLYYDPKDSSKNKFILLNCPWCNDKFFKNQEKPKGYKILGKKKFFH